MGILEREERDKGIEEIFLKITTKNFYQINVRHQTTELLASLARTLREQQAG